MAATTAVSHAGAPGANCSPTAPRTPTSPGFYRTASGNFEALVDENERMLIEISDLRAQVDGTAAVRAECAQLAEENRELQRKLELSDAARSATQPFEDMLARNNETLEKMRVFVDTLLKAQEQATAAAAATATAAAARAADSSESSQKADTAARRELESENAALRHKVQQLVTELSKTSMFYEQEKSDNESLHKKVREAEAKNRELLNANTQLMAKYGVSSEEGRRLHERLSRAKAENNASAVLQLRLDQLLNKGDQVGRQELRQLFSDFFDMQERAEQFHNDQVAALKLSWRESEEEFQQEIGKLRRRVNELEAENRTIKLTIRRDPQDGRTLVTPRAQPLPSSSSSQFSSPSFHSTFGNKNNNNGGGGGGDGAASAGRLDSARSTASAGGRNLMDELRGSAVTTPRNPSSPGYVKRCPSCRFENSGRVSKCQLCNALLSASV